MPTISSNRQFDGLGPAGGVLAGTYPNPDFAQPMATVNQLIGKADLGHTHTAGDINSGVLGIDRIPTSSTPSTTALARADHPGLSDTRPWNKYDNTVAPAVGNVPIWNGTKYAPAVAPSAQDPPTATTNRRGVIQLAGDLSGTAVNPKVVIRGPVGGHIGLTPTSGAVTPDASVSTSFYVSATTNFTLNPPSNPTDGQRIIVEIFASGAARTITLASGITNASGVARSLTPAAGKVGIYEIHYAVRASRWIARFASVEL